MARLIYIIIRFAFSIRHAIFFDVELIGRQVFGHGLSIMHRSSIFVVSDKSRKKKRAQIVLKDFKYH